MHSSAPSSSQQYSHTFVKRGVQQIITSFFHHVYSLFERLEGEAEDPLLRADAAKRDRAQEDPTDEAVPAAATEPPVDQELDEKGEAASLEKAMVKQVNYGSYLQYLVYLASLAVDSSTGCSIGIISSETYLQCIWNRCWGSHNVLQSPFPPM